MTRPPGGEAYICTGYTNFRTRQSQAAGLRPPDPGQQLFNYLLASVKISRQKSRMNRAGVTRIYGKTPWTIHDPNGNDTMKEPRRQERRDYYLRQQFPFLGSTGTIILQDRRKMADRRSNNIWLELISLPLGDIPPGWGR